MRALTFELSGKTAFFKKPELNTYVYFTYNNIHKVALMGLLGAILGLGGYNQQTSVEGERPQYPEFYQSLKDMKTAIIPMAKQPQGRRTPHKDLRGTCFSKKIQVFNNSIGYASYEEGGNLIVREQWLENPSWRIYILEDDSLKGEVFDTLAEYLQNSKCVYIPYLGKNDHPAGIWDCQIVELEMAEEEDHIDSLFVGRTAEAGGMTYDDLPIFLFKEVAPIRLNSQYNFYEYEELWLTNREILNLNTIENIYVHGETVLAFF